MADNSTSVRDVKIAVTNVPELKTSAKGTEFLKFKGVHEDGNEKTWFSLVAFGPMAKNLNGLVTKGTKILASGKVSQKEYMTKEGKPGVENNMIVNEAKVATKQGVVAVDEFYTAKEPF